MPRRIESRFTVEVMADNYEQIYTSWRISRRKAQGTAARPERRIHDVSLAGEAAHRWHRGPEDEGLNTRPKSDAPVLKLFQIARRGIR